MKNYTKNSYKSLLTLSLTMVLYCPIQADIASTINGGDPARNLSALHYELAALGTSSDISGVYDSLNTIVNDVTTLGTTPLATAAGLASAVAPLATSAGLTAAVAPLATSAGLIAAVAPLATSAKLTSAVAPLATSAGVTSAVAPLATSAGVTSAVAPLATSAGVTSAVAPLATSAGLASAVAPLATSAGLASAVALLATSAGVTSAVAPLATSAELSSAVAPLATSAGLTSAVAPLATSAGLTSAVAPLATASALSAVDGHVTRLGTTALATSAQAAALSSNIASLGTASDVSGLYALLAVIIANLQLDPISQVVSVASSRALTSNKKTVTSDDTNKDAIAYLAAYNKNLGSALTFVTTATTFATQSNANTVLAINAVNTAIDSFNILAIQWDKDGARPSSSCSVAEINGALYQLKYALIYLLTQQPIA